MRISIKFSKYIFLLLLILQNKYNYACCTKDLIQGNLDVNCNEFVAGNLNVSGSLISSGDLNVNGTITANSGVITNNANVSGNLTVCGQISTCGGSVYVPVTVPITEYLSTFSGYPSGVISPTANYTEIAQYYYPTGLVTGVAPYPTGTLFTLPLYTLTGGTTGFIKYIGLENEKVAPTQVRTNRGSMVLNGNYPFALTVTGNTQIQYGVHKDLIGLLYSKDHWKKIPFNEGLNGSSCFVDKQQAKLIGNGYGNVQTSAGGPYQGWSVSLSADGNTLAEGGRNDYTGIGATWVFTRSGSVWSQQGNKLIGGPTGGTQGQGYSVALSADGNTLAVGAPFTTVSSQIGVVWIFTRTGSTWTQQSGFIGPYLPTGTPQFGYSVSLSADGNTLAVGGNNDNSGAGATWIYTRSGSTWTRQGTKLVGSGGITANQGSSVSLSADGNTLAIGGNNDNVAIGATWIFTRDISGNWIQQGTKLVGTGRNGASGQGISVSLSANGNTLAVGGNNDLGPDNNSLGATWIFNRTGSNWAQQGNKLVGSNYISVAVAGYSHQGRSVSLSADGNTLAVGSQSDKTNQGAFWIFTRSGSNWIQQTNKLGVSDNQGNEELGTSINLSADGNTLAVGGRVDNLFIGATWVFV